MNQFYIAVVEDRNDPLFLGRCRVRVIGIHTDSKIDLPTEDLPWAHPMTPITSASMSGVGQSPVGPVEGSNVVVFFKDSTFQYPIMIGTIPGFNIKATSDSEYREKVTNISSLTPLENEDVADPTIGFKDPSGNYPRFYDEQDSNRLSRRQSIDKTIVQQKLNSRYVDISVANSDGIKWSQSPTSYNTLYPFNHVYESESGHIFEFDDTPNAERVHLYHRKGTFTEVDNNGSQVNKIVGNGYLIIDNDGYILIKGSCIVNIEGDSAIKVNGNSHLECAGSVNLNANKDINVNSNTNVSIKTKDSLNIEAKDIKIKTTGFSLTSDNIDAKYSQLAADGKTFFNSGKANPKLPEIIWVKFTKALKQFFVPSLDDEAIIELEDLTNAQKIEILKAQGFSDSSPIIQDLKKSQEIKEEIPISELEKSTAPTIEVICDNIVKPITNSTQLSQNFKLGDFLKASAKGKVVAQGGLTEEEIVCNLKWIATNIAEPIKKKYGSSFIITSGYRRGNGSSQHDRGQAIDLQFSDCKSRNDYMIRCKELIAMLPIDQIIFEQTGGKTWIHISSKSTGNRNKITSYDGSKYMSGLVLVA